MTLLHGSDRKAIFQKIGRYEFFAEIPTRFNELISGGVSKESSGGTTEIHIGGISVLISRM